MTIVLYAALALLSVPVLYIAYRRSDNALLPFIMSVKGLMAIYVISLMLDGDVALAAGDISLIATGIMMLLGSSNLNARYALTGGDDER